VLRTPRLELRPDDDPGLLELAQEARLGVHPPETMPFAVPWTDAGPDERARAVLQHHWGERSAVGPRRWSVHLLVRLDGRVIGVQDVEATEFAVTREVDTGSWIGLRHQGRGIGTEMRAAVLTWAFDHLGATRARSAAFVDNAASRRVSEKLGYPARRRRQRGAAGTARRQGALPAGARRVRAAVLAPAGRGPRGVPAAVGRPAGTGPGHGTGTPGRRRAPLPRHPRLTPRANVSHCAGSPVR
jgi:RimJ/RimL family protein N-acetyltransferase